MEHILYSFDFYLSSEFEISILALFKSISFTNILTGIAEIFPSVADIDSSKTKTLSNCS